MIKVREGLRLTKKQAELIEAINRELESGRWVVVPGKPYILLRFTEGPLETPDILQKSSTLGGVYCRATYPFPSYERHVFLSLIASVRGSWVLQMSNAAAPWVRNQDSNISMARAFEVLSDPRSVWGGESDATESH